MKGLNRILLLFMCALLTVSCKHEFDENMYSSIYDKTIVGTWYFSANKCLIVFEENKRCYYIDIETGEKSHQMYYYLDTKGTKPGHACLITLYAEKEPESCPERAIYDFKFIDENICEFQYQYGCLLRCCENCFAGTDSTISLKVDQVKQLYPEYYISRLPHKLVTWTSSDPDIVDVDSLGRIEAKREGQACINFKFRFTSVSGTCNVSVAAQPDINGHKYVEIGGSKWATMNLGATTIAGDRSTCFGDYYCSGETSPRYTGLNIADDGSVVATGWKKEYPNGYSGKLDYHEVTLDSKHDAATQHWGEEWRSPIYTDFKNLYDACGNIWYNVADKAEVKEKGIYWCENYDNVSGLVFCDGENRLFLPAAGRMNSTTSTDCGTKGYYWENFSRYNNQSVQYLYFDKERKKDEVFDRSNGCSIRPILRY